MGAMSHEFYMRNALNLARRGLGRTWPNPTVGCVIVKHGEILARARTADEGRPHAETQALQTIGDHAQLSTVYVTLEPCSHTGKTGPCAESLIKAGVSEVVIGCTDPDPRVSGNGIKMLLDAGIKVTTAILEAECRDLNKGFFKRIEKNQPYVMLKAAISADYKYLPGDGTQPRWVTGDLSRHNVHSLRAQYDAILTGTSTVLDDNPFLNCRLPGMEIYSPVKVVIGKTRIPENANIFSGKECILLDGTLKNILNQLAEKGFTRIMVEAGPKLSNALLQEGLADEVVVFKSPNKLGKSGKDFFAPKVLDGFKKIEERDVDEDKRITLIANL